MDQAYRVAIRARAYRLLAQRPELRTHDHDDRLRHALEDEPPGRMRALDAILVHQAGELDILCGYAVALLSRPGARTSELLDLLGMLDPEHLLAIYFALPEDRRRAVTRDFVWTYYVSRAPAAEIERALHELEVVDPEPISEPSRALAQWAWSDPRASA